LFMISLTLGPESLDKRLDRLHIWEAKHQVDPLSKDTCEPNLPVPHQYYR
jgi:hypothetical protein